MIVSFMYFDAARAHGQKLGISGPQVWFAGGPHLERSCAKPLNRALQLDIIN